MPGTDRQRDRQINKVNKHNNGFIAETKVHPHKIKYTEKVSMRRVKLNYIYNLEVSLAHARKTVIERCGEEARLNLV